MIKEERPTFIYKGIRHGDWVDCKYCNRTMLLPIGAEICPECYNKALAFHDLAHQEIDADDISNCRESNASLMAADCDSANLFGTLVDKYGGKIFKAMLTSDSLWSVTRALKKWQCNRLRIAISAHRDKYDFAEYDEDEEEIYDTDDCPIVMAQANDYYGSASTDVYVLSVRMTNNELKLLVADKTYTMREISPMDVALEHLQFIIDDIPLTDCFGNGATL